jgi:threonine dehydratase
VARTPADYLRAILTARVYDVARETELTPAPGLSARTGCTVLLKREDSQPAFSFKVRGAYNRMSALGAQELARGVIAASAGNHAQGVALSAARLGCRAVIVMPVTTPRVKVDAVRSLGGDRVGSSSTATRTATQRRGPTPSPASGGWSGCTRSTTRT